MSAIKLPSIALAGPKAWALALVDFDGGDRAPFDALMRAYRSDPATANQLIGPPPAEALDAEIGTRKGDGRRRNASVLTQAARDELLRKAGELREHYTAGLGAIREEHARDGASPLGWLAIDHAPAVREVRAWLARCIAQLATEYGVSVSTVKDYMKPSRNHIPTLEPAQPQAPVAIEPDDWPAILADLRAGYAAGTVTSDDARRAWREHKKKSGKV